MTREDFIEMVLDQAHRAHLYYEEGQTVDMTIMLGHRNKETKEEKEPTVNVLLRGKLRR